MIKSIVERTQPRRCRCSNQHVFARRGSFPLTTILQHFRRLPTTHKSFWAKRFRKIQLKRKKRIEIKVNIVIGRKVRFGETNWETINIWTPEKDESCETHLSNARIVKAEMNFIQCQRPSELKHFARQYFSLDLARPPSRPEAGFGYNSDEPKWSPYTRQTTSKFECFRFKKDIKASGRHLKQYFYSFEHQTFFK